MLERQGAFFELIELRGTRYGVTNSEMKKKMAEGLAAPAIILEPKGLEIYKQKCAEMGWDVFKVFVHVPEKTRIERLVKRTLSEIESNIPFSAAPSNRMEAILRTHTDRLLSICHDERGWINSDTWDVVVPGDDAIKAVEMIKHGVAYRNFKLAPATPFKSPYR